MTLTQKKLFQGTQEFRLTDDDHIHISFRGSGTERSFTLPLLEIDPRPARIKARPLGRLIVAFAFGFFAALVFVSAVVQSNPAEQGPIAFGGAILAGISFLCFRDYRRRATNIIAFYSRANGQALLTPWYGVPNQASFDAFIQEVTNRINAAIARVTQTQSNDTMSGEIRALKKLCDDGLLTTDQYEKAKQKLIESPKERPPIGFRPNA